MTSILAVVENPELAYLAAAATECDDGVVVTDAAGLITYVNRGFERMCGHVAAQVIGRRPGDFLQGPETDQAEVARIREAIRRRERISSELVNYRADGTPYWVWMRIGPVLGADGTVARFVSIERDVTDRKQAERALREYGRELNALTEDSPDIIVRFGSDLRYRYVNRAFEQLHELRRESVLGRTLEEAGVPPDVATQWNEALRDVLATGRQRALTFELDGAEGPRTFDARLAPEHNGSATNVSVLVVTRDVTEERRTARALRESEERFRAFIEHSAEIVTILEADGTIRYESPAIERMLGWRTDELNGHSAFEFVHPDDAASVRALFERTVREPGTITPLAFRFRHKDGSWRVLESIGANALDNPAIGGILVNSHDATERQRLEAELWQAQKLEAVGLLAGGIAHDFNNLLTVIRGHVELLMMELDAGDTRRDDLAEVQTAADRAASLTSQLLAFARRQMLQPRVVELNAVVASLESVLRRLALDRITLVTRLDSAVCNARVDPGKLEQVIMNLAINARDAMEAGGTMTVATRHVHVADNDLAHPGVPAGEYAVLSVSDSGPGIDEAVLPHIFEPFFTTKRRAGGTGLGLATVHGIVQQSGGHVRVESSAERGTTFTVYLPYTAGAVDRGPDALPPPAPEGHAGVVLIVDDEAGVLRIARRALTGRGYHVLTAHDGAEALRLLERGDPHVDVLLADLVMPGMSGREVVERAIAIRPALACVLMSGYTDDPLVYKALAVSHLPFLQKPFSVEDLARAVGNALQHAG